MLLKFSKTCTLKNILIEMLNFSFRRIRMVWSVDCGKKIFKHYSLNDLLFSINLKNGCLSKFEVWEIPHEDKEQIFLFLWWSFSNEKKIYSIKQQSSMTYVKTWKYIKSAFFIFTPFIYLAKWFLILYTFNISLWFIIHCYFFVIFLLISLVMKSSHHFKY